MKTLTTHTSKKSALQSYRLKIIPRNIFQTVDLLLKGLGFSRDSLKNTVRFRVTYPILKVFV